LRKALGSWVTLPWPPTVAGGLKTSTLSVMIPPGARSLSPLKITVRPSGSITWPGYQRPSAMSGWRVHCSA